MGTLRYLRILILISVIASVHSSQAQEIGVGEIRIPYGLGWGDSIDKIHGIIQGVKARELSCMDKGGGKIVIEADGLGLGNPLLRKSLFIFRDGSLIEVELQYADTTWDSDKSLDFFDRTRRRIDEKYGSGTLLVNKIRETALDPAVPKDTSYTLIIYDWVQPMVALELNFYTMEESTRVFRLVSLRYKAP